MKQRPIGQNKENPDEETIQIYRNQRTGDIFQAKKEERVSDIQRILCRRRAKRLRNDPNRASSALYIDHLRTDRLL